MIERMIYKFTLEEMVLIYDAYVNKTSVCLNRYNEIVNRCGGEEVVDSVHALHNDTYETFLKRVVSKKGYKYKRS